MIASHDPDDGHLLALTLWVFIHINELAESLVTATIL